MTDSVDWEGLELIRMVGPRCHEVIHVTEKTFPQPFYGRCIKDMNHSGWHMFYDEEFNWRFQFNDGRIVGFSGTCEIGWESKNVWVGEKLWMIDTALEKPYKPEFEIHEVRT